MTKVAYITAVLIVFLSLQGCQYRPKPVESKNTVQSKLENNELSKVIEALNTDLDNDGYEEKLEVIESIKGNGDGAVEVEGILRVTNKSVSKEISYRKSGNQLTGVFQDIKIEDLNGDGVKDIIVIIPDMGSAGFMLNYFFIFDYKNEKHFSFNQDYILANMSDFFEAFKFTYMPKGKLRVHNEHSGYKAYLNVQPVENMDAYSRAWLDPAPSAVINEEYSKSSSEGRYLSSIDIVSGKDSSTEIRIPFLIFGQSAGDVIGEIDVFFSINKGLKPAAKRFEIFDFNDDFKRTKVGESIL